MGYQFAALFDPGALSIVVAGTILATLARCGWSDIHIATRAVIRLGKTEFADDANRRALAPAISDIKRRGPLCTDIPLPPDRSLAKILIAYARSGSMDMLDYACLTERKTREMTTAQAVRTFEYAGELAPVFGLVGTLFAITQLAPFAGEGTVDIAMASIATAVLSSLYGVLLAHMFCIPIARAIDRKAQREEAAREAVIEWVIASIGGGPRLPKYTRKDNLSGAYQSAKDAA